VNENYVHKKRKLRPPPPVAVVRPMQVPENNSTRNSTKKDCANNYNSQQNNQKNRENNGGICNGKDFPGKSLTSGGSNTNTSTNQIQTSTNSCEEESAVALPVKKRRESTWNDMEMYKKMRKQIEQKRKNMFPVCPKPPEGFKDYLMNKKTYLLQDNAQERLRSMPMIQPPPSLSEPLRELFVLQEKDRFKLRTKHMVEKEKLILSVEQVIFL